MEIKTSTYEDESIVNSEINGNEAFIRGNVKFKNYDSNTDINMIMGRNPIKSDLFFNKTDTLNEVHSIGKKFYKKLEDKLKEAHVAYIEKINQLNDEPQIGKLIDDSEEKSPLDNSFIWSFLPNKIFNDKKICEDIMTICLEYCEQNGFPLVDDTNSDYIEDSSSEEYFFFNIQPFVALSVLIYIIYEVQNNVRELLNFKVGKSLEGQTIRTMFDKSDFYSIDEYLDNIYQFAWLFDVTGTTSNDKYDLSILEIAEGLTNIMNIIQHTTSYLQFGMQNTFYSEDRKFSIIETHTNVMSIAWEKLKLAIFPYSGGIVKKCRNCGRIFETDTNATSYCSEKCKQERFKINSNNSYNKFRSLHSTLCGLYSTVNKSNFALLDKDVQQNIILYTSLDITAFKKLNDKNKIKNMEKYIELLK